MTGLFFQVNCYSFNCYQTLFNSRFNYSLIFMAAMFLSFGSRMKIWINLG